MVQSPDVRVWHENTAVAALVEWGAGPYGQAATPEQRRTLAGLLRLQHCTHSYLAHLLPNVRTYGHAGAHAAAADGPGSGGVALEAHTHHVPIAIHANAICSTTAAHHITWWK